MESPLSFDSTENFRKKLLVRNLKPYKVDGSYSSNETPARQEFQIVDYSVIDSPNVEDIGNNQEKILFPLNKYGPQDTKSTYGDTIKININRGTESNFGEYDYSDTIGSKLEQIGNTQENLLYVKNLYGPTQFDTSYGNTVDINDLQGPNENIGVYGYPKTIGSNLEQIGNYQEVQLIVLNTYKPQTIDGDFGSTRWTINNNLVVQTNGSGEYNIQDTVGSKLEQIGNQQEVLNKIKNVYKNSGSDFGNTAYSILNDLVINTTGQGLYSIEDTFNNYLEQIGNSQEIFLRVKNKYNPQNGSDFGESRYDINDDSQVLGTNQGEYSTTTALGSLLEINAISYRTLLFPINQYGPEGSQSTATVNPNINQQQFSNEGNYDFNDTIGSNIEIIAENTLNFGINKYGPNNLPTTNAGLVINVNEIISTNEGEYSQSNTNNNKLDQIATIEENDAYIINRYVPGEGTYGDPDLVTVDDIFVQTTGQRYYNSEQSFVFLPSEYSPISLLSGDDPQGSNGPLSQDSALANIAAQRLQKEFKYRIAAELLSETVGRINALESSVDPNSGEISVKPNLDPFNAVGIISGNVPLLSRNYRVTAPDLVTGKIINFAAKLAGLYSPYSIIPDEYFDYPKKRLLNQLLENPVALATQTVMGAIRSITSKNIRRGSDLFLAYTTPATRDLLWGQLFYNEYRPDYRGNSLRNPNLFSPKPNFYIGERKNTITDILNPIKDLPEYKDGDPLFVDVYGFSDVAKDFEGEKISNIFFGLNTRNFYDGNNSITSNFSWATKNSFFAPGKKVGKAGRQEFDSSSVFSAEIKKQFTDSESYKNDFREGSILDITQKIVDAGSRKGGRPLEHVGNAINQVSKVFNDGYIEITKGSRVIKYTTKNSLETNGSEFRGLEYCRIFTKDTPFYTYGQAQKTSKNIRNFDYSVLDSPYNLNIAPWKGDNSTNIKDGKVKKYMFSLENLAWRTSNKQGFLYNDLPACERGPNGGRIMWFPPYDLSFDESVRADFTPVDFIGRPEPIYTYKNTNRTGNLSWTILVDHPSITDLMVEQELKGISPESEITKIMDSFFAGCLKYDLYDLAKKYAQFAPQDIQEAINQVKSKEDIEKITSETNPSQTDSIEEINNTIEELDDQNKEYFLFFETSQPSGGGEETDNDFEYWYNLYLGNQEDYNQQPLDKIIAYPSKSDLDPQELPNDSEDFDYKDYIDTRLSAVENFFEDRVKSSLNTLQEFTQKIATVLDSGGKVNFDLVGTASSTSGSENNKKLSSRRIDSVIDYILKYEKNGKKLETYYKKELKINAKPLGDNLSNLKDKELKEIDCKEKFRDDYVDGKYSVQSMACRRVKIENVKVEAGKPKKEENTAGDGQPANISEAQTGNQVTTTPKTGQYSNTTIKDSSLYQNMTKKLIRKLLSECNYFEMLESNSPVVYDGIKRRFKHFNPAFHSITPEGLNSRLTFLQQCMRPGDTIPTVTQTASGSFTLSNQDAFNSAFGSPPVLVLRIGDFYHTKIIPENLSIKFDKDGVFDLNPEGIGVQPMYATITLSFKFIGGSGLAAPISKLQNALSFNYYANTEMYDERADSTEPLKDAYDAEFFESLKTVVNTNSQQNNENSLGTYIGDKGNATEQPNGTESGTITYKKLMDECIPLVQNYVKTTTSQLKQLNQDHLLGGLYVLNTERKFQEGKFYTLDVKIYGKSEKTQNKIDLLFNKIKDDIDSDLIPVLSEVDFQNFTNNQKNKIKKQLKKLVDERKQKYLTDIDTYNNKIVEEELKLIQNVDKLNYVCKGIDGKLNKSNKPLIVNLTGTTPVDVSNTSYTNTLEELRGDFKDILGGDLNNFINKLTEYKIITNDFNEKWEDSFQFNLYIGTANESQNRFNMVFGIDVINNPDKFVESIVSVLNQNDRQDWKNFIYDNLDIENGTPVANGLTDLYIQQKKNVEERFNKFEQDEYFKKINQTYNPYNKGKARVINFSSQLPINQIDSDDLLKLGSKVNSTDSSYNLKKTFN